VVDSAGDDSTGALTGLERGEPGSAVFQCRAAIAEAQGLRVAGLHGVCGLVGALFIE
jgi:ammonia channel protein AmtB